MESNGKMLTSFIHDGFTCKGYIDGMEGVYPDASFTFRPALSQERAVGESKIVSSPAKESESVVAQTIARHVTEWDLLKAKTLDSDELVPVELKLADILRVPQSLTFQIYNTIMGNRSPGSPPGVNPETIGDQIDTEYDAMMSETSVEETEVKNSEKG